MFDSNVSFGGLCIAQTKRLSCMAKTNVTKRTFEYHIEWFGLQGSQLAGLHSVIEVYNMNEQKILV